MLRLTLPNYTTCNVLYDKTEVHKLDSTIPITLQICDPNDANVVSSSIVLNATGVTKVSGSPTDGVEDPGDANSEVTFRYDASLGGTGSYIFNLSVDGLSPGTWKSNFTVGDAPFAYSV